MVPFPKKFLQLLLLTVLVCVGKRMSANAEGNSVVEYKIELHKRVVAEGGPVQYINCHKRKHSSQINARCGKTKEWSDPENCPSQTFSERMSIVFWIVMASFPILTFVQKRASTNPVQCQNPRTFLQKVCSALWWPAIIATVYTGGVALFVPRQERRELIDYLTRWIRQVILILILRTLPMCLAIYF
ncbi:unnamed protein product [Orchesella dallaii]|uniref:Uncharacterized protein n=1 Tax=Orchesella dallaii TaxID=48710 RepID=A0ABP1RY93_9HEXA